MTPDALDRLEQQARKQIGPEMSTPVAILPGELLVLIAGYRRAHPAAEPSTQDTTYRERP